MMAWKEDLVASFPGGSAARVYELELHHQDGFLATDEKIPAGLFEDLAATLCPDGYLVGAAAGRYSYGMGCGNALALLEAFPERPRGLILADPDLAVVCGLETLVDGMARHSGFEGFLAEFLAGGEDALWAQVEEVFRGREARGLAVPDERSRQRLRRGLRPLTPLRRDRLDPSPGEAPSVWSRVVRVYGRLHELSREGAIAVVQASILDPDFLAAVSRLPGFGQAANVFYLSNLADHEVRRLLFASARRKLGLAVGGSELPQPGSTPELVARVNVELARLGPLAAASGRAVFVHTSETHDLVLMARAEPPRYRAEGFFLQIDLDRMVQGLFEATAAGGTGEGAAPGDPWRAAAAFQKTARRLFGAAVRRDRDRVGATLEQLAREIEDLPLLAGGDRSRAAFRLAELGEGVVLARQGFSEAFPRLLSRLTEEIRITAGRLAGDVEPSLDRVAAPEVFLLAHACAVAGALLGDSRLGGLAGRLAAAGLAGPRPERELLGLRVEALLRLLRCHLHHPADDVAEVVRQEVRELIQRIGPTGALDPGVAPSAAEAAPLSGYGRHVLAGDVISDNARLLFVFEGLAEESLAPMRAALLMMGLGAVPASATPATS
jgi:hypothetical protein